MLYLDTDHLAHIGYVIIRAVYSGAALLCLQFQLVATRLITAKMPLQPMKTFSSQNLKSERQLVKQQIHFEPLEVLYM